MVFHIVCARPGPVERHACREARPRASHIVGSTLEFARRYDAVAVLIVNVRYLKRVPNRERRLDASNPKRRIRVVEKSNLSYQDFRARLRSWVTKSVKRLPSVSAPIIVELQYEVHKPVSRTSTVTLRSILHGV